MAKRLVQIFMVYKSDAPGPAVFEVEIDELKVATCSCPGFTARNKCKHASLVNERMAENNGAYPFHFLSEVSDEDIKAALKTEQGFRDFIIKRAKIEVI